MIHRPTPIPGENSCFVFPSLINQERPHKIDPSDPGEITYEVSGAVENIFPSLVALLGYTNIFVRNNNWQDRAEYELATGEICGFKVTETKPGNLEIMAYFGEKTSKESRTLFQGLFESLLARQNATVTRYKPVICPSCHEKQEPSAVKARNRAGKKTSFCSYCGERIELPGAVYESSLKAQDDDRIKRGQAQAKLRTKLESIVYWIKAILRERRRLTPSPICFISYSGDVKDKEYAVKLERILRQAGIQAAFEQQADNVGSEIQEIRGSDFFIILGTPKLRERYDLKLRSYREVIHKRELAENGLTK